MKTIRIVNRGHAAGRFRASGVLFQDRGGCWHAHVPSLWLTGYGWSRQAAYASLEVMARAYLRWMGERVGMAGLAHSMCWRKEGGEWCPPPAGEGELREVTGYMRKSGVMKPFSLLVEEVAAEGVIIN